MKQVWLRDMNHLEIINQERPKLPVGGVVMAMRTVALCRTDVKIIRRGHRDLVLPRIPGHEGVGEIIESDSFDLPSGTMAAVYPGHFCGTCSICRQGMTARCPSLSIFGFNRDGFFRTMVPFERQELSSLVPCPSDMDSAIAVLAEPLACCLSAIRKFPGVERGAALVVGAGAVGCLLAALLVSLNWQRVMIVDRDPDRLDGEIPQGVEALVATSTNLFELLKETGLTASLNLLIPACPGGLDWPFEEMMAPGGCVSVFSGMEGEGIREVAMNRLHYGEWVLAGSYGCNRVDFADALGLLSRQAVDASFLTPVVISLEEVMNGVALLEGHKAKKIIINHF
jgi:L-iditol 2-dehydrogenase